MYPSFLKIILIEKNREILTCIKYMYVQMQQKPSLKYIQFA